MLAPWRVRLAPRRVCDQSRATRISVRVTSTCAPLRAMRGCLRGRGVTSGVGRHGERTGTKDSRAGRSAARAGGTGAPSGCPRVAPMLSGTSGVWSSLVAPSRCLRRRTTPDWARSMRRAGPLDRHPHCCAPVKRCRDGEQRRRSQPTAPEQSGLDVIQTAVWFVATQAGGPARILAAHRRLPDGYCLGCLATPMRWPCTVAAIATNAISAQNDLGLILPNRS